MVPESQESREFSLPGEHPGCTGGAGATEEEVSDLGRVTSHRNRMERGRSDGRATSSRVRWGRATGTHLDGKGAQDRPKSPMQRKCVQSQRRCLPANSTRNVMTSGQGTAPKTQRVLCISTGRGPFHPPALLNKSSPNMRWAHTSNLSIRRLRQEDEEFRASHKARPFPKYQKSPKQKTKDALSRGSSVFLSPDTFGQGAPALEPNLFALDLSPRSLQYPGSS